MSNAPQLPPIHADMAMLEQVIVNMALNARDAMPKGGRLAISTRLVAIDPTGVRRNSEARLGQFVCLSLQDTGCGMDAGTLSRIFEPFFTTKDVGKGTGLGLAMVYGIVKQHQGWVEVESQVGRGSTFHIFLPGCPRSPAPPPPAPPARVSAPAVCGGTETILVVEDEPAVRELVRHVLEVSGYRVIPAANGKEALQLWQEHGSVIDLLLTDMVMPEGISGLELSQTLKSERANLKVIYTSGYGMEQYIRNMGLQEGVNFLPKPYPPGRLAQAVRSCLDS